MMKAVKDSGFTPVPEEVRLVVTGRLEAREQRFVLVLDRMQEPMTLTCDATGAVEVALAGHAGQTVEIRGRWQFEGGGSLRVEVVEAMPAAP
jgi:hypothetical protein